MKLLSNSGSIMTLPKKTLVGAIRLLLYRRNNMDKDAGKSAENIINYLSTVEERHWREADEPDAGHIFCDIRRVAGWLHAHNQYHDPASKLKTRSNCATPSHRDMRNFGCVSMAACIRARPSRQAAMAAFMSLITLTKPSRSSPAENYAHREQHRPRHEARRVRGLPITLSNNASLPVNAHNPWNHMRTSPSRASAAQTSKASDLTVVR